MDFNAIFKDVIVPVLISGLSAMLAYFLKNGIDFLKTKVKESMHFRGADVVSDSVFQAVAELGDEFQKSLADGKITSEEKEKIKDLAKKLAKDKLLHLSGFYKKELDKWIDEQLKIGLAKLLARTL